MNTRFLCAISIAVMCESEFGFVSGSELFELDSDSDSDLKTLFQIRIWGNIGGFASGQSPTVSFYLTTSMHDSNPSTKRLKKV